MAIVQPPSFCARTSSGNFEDSDASAADRDFLRKLRMALDNGPHRGTLLAASLILTIFAVIAIINFSGRANIYLGAFGSFWDSGYAVSHHLNPYGVYSRTPKFFDSLYTHQTFVSLNLSPPPLLPLFQAFSYFNPAHAAQIWAGFSLLLFLLSMALLWVEYSPHIQRRQILWFLLGSGAVHTLLLAQDYAPLTFLAVLAWILLKHNRPIAAGFLLGLFIVVKPNFAQASIFLALCGFGRAAKSSILTASGACLVPALLYGPSVYLEWFRAIGHDPHWIFYSDVSFTGIASRLGFRLIGQAISVLVLVGLTIFVARKKPAADITLGLAFTAGLLCSPLAWVWYSLFLAPFLLARPWSWRFTFAIAPMMIPSAIVALYGDRSPHANTIVSLLYFIPVCWILVYFFRRAITAQPTLTLSEENAPSTTN